MLDVFSEALRYVVSSNVNSGIRTPIIYTRRRLACVQFGGNARVAKPRVSASGAIQRLASLAKLAANRALSENSRPPKIACLQARRRLDSPAEM